MVRFLGLIICLAVFAAGLVLAPQLVSQDYANDPLVGTAVIFLMIVGAPAILLATEWTIPLFPVAVVAIVILGWKALARKQVLATRLLFIVWIWSGLIGLAALVIANPGT